MVELAEFRRDEFRERLRAMSDEQLIKYGKAAAYMADPNIFSRRSNSRARFQDSITRMPRRVEEEAPEGSGGNWNSPRNKKGDSMKTRPAVRFAKSVYHKRKGPKPFGSSPDPCQGSCWQTRAVYHESQCAGDLSAQLHPWLQTQSLGVQHQPI